MIEFKVPGMTCGGCVRSITGALQRVDPNAQIGVDLSGKMVSVSSRARVEQLRQAIEGAGFEVSQ